MKRHDDEVRYALEYRLDELRRERENLTRWVVLVGFRRRKLAVVDAEIRAVRRLLTVDETVKGAVEEGLARFSRGVKR